LRTSWLAKPAHNLSIAPNTNCYILANVNLI
jgi:hypothetical protein